ncbi:MAG: hypothetical protein JW990_03825 [Thermoleophilia bacterium]|nr:hypothetical protein [Thermoleophilia bacterium]
MSDVFSVEDRLHMAYIELKAGGLLARANSDYKHLLGSVRLERDELGNNSGLLPSNAPQRTAHVWDVDGMTVCLGEYVRVRVGDVDVVSVSRNPGYSHCTLERGPWLKRFVGYLMDLEDRMQSTDRKKEAERKQKEAAIVSDRAAKLEAARAAFESHVGEG